MFIYFYNKLLSANVQIFNLTNIILVCQLEMIICISQICNTKIGVDGIFLNKVEFLETHIYIYI